MTDIKCYIKVEEPVVGGVVISDCHNNDYFGKELSLTELMIEFQEWLNSSIEASNIYDEYKHIRRTMDGSENVLFKNMHKELQHEFLTEKQIVQLKD